MPNVMKVLKDEIQRLARKEIKTAVAAAHRETMAVKKSLVGVKRELARLQRAIKQLGRGNKLAIVAETQGEGEPVEKMRVTAKGMRSLRAKLGLSQAEFGKLIGVSGQSVYQWERKNGPIGLRKATKRRLAEVREMGRKDAQKALAGE